MQEFQDFVKFMRRFTTDTDLILGNHQSRMEKQDANDGGLAIPTWAIASLAPVLRCRGLPSDETGPIPKRHLTDDFARAMAPAIAPEVPESRAPRALWIRRRRRPP